LHPAFSVILFTTASGAGYGLIALTGLLFAAGAWPGGPGVGLAALVLATLLVTGGLFASTAHLGHPERAWRALTQIRTSWLSREGLAALLAYPPLAGLALGWGLLGLSNHVMLAAALVAAILSIATVHCTAMIYRSLKPIHQWCNPHVVPVYHLLALMTGAQLLNALLHLAGAPSRGIGLLAALATAGGAFVKERYWRFIDTNPGASTPESATGLTGLGKVRLLEPPHTGSNYVMREMGFQIARRHALKLRRLALALGFALPMVLLLAAGLLPPLPAMLAALVAAFSGLVGVLAERWLFFAEAKHSVTLYYGIGTV
jgi:DMSO reductase anchor subunit